jgi:hypothetical protein
VHLPAAGLSVLSLDDADACSPNATYYLIPGSVPIARRSPQNAAVVGYFPNPWFSSFYI